MPVISGSGSLNKIGTDTLTLSSISNYSGGTTITSGLLIGSNGLTSLGTGPIAVNGGDAILRNTSAASVSALLHSGYNGGSWNGSGISSYSAANDSQHLTAVGMLQPLSTTTFDGQSLGATDVALKFTYYGDTNLDGKVDGSDYARLDNGYLTHLTGWANGDFNYDGLIDGSDYTLIDNAFNTQGAMISNQISTPPATATAQLAGSAETSAVPEPAMLGVITLGAWTLSGRRRRVG